MQVGIGNNFGIYVGKKPQKFHILLMLRQNQQVSYSHFEEHIGIGWTRVIEFGKRKWWFTENWNLYAHRTKTHQGFVLRRRTQ